MRKKNKLFLENKSLDISKSFSPLASLLLLHSPFKSPLNPHLSTPFKSAHPVLSSTSSNVKQNVK